MVARLLTVTFEVSDPAGVARFWSGLLGREVVEDEDGWRIPTQDAQVGLRFVENGAEKTGPNRMHLHLTSATSADQKHTVAKALGLGAHHLDVGQRPEEKHVVLSDPAGNEFCVIEPGNVFLARCGFLGEIACEGTREVGLFWSEALHWRLVWDQHGETAIQSPQGGTKVAWGGPPVAPKTGGDRQRFELSPADGEQPAEVDRLVSLGAKPVELGRDGVVVLSDPDGNEFSVKAN